MKMQKILIFLSPIILFFVVIFGHKILTNIFFNHFCETETGLFVYEKIELDESYFSLIDEAKRDRGYDNRFEYNDQYSLDTANFKSEYQFNFIVNDKYSNIGPIYSKTTSLIRKSDKKLLGKAVSGTAYIGLFRVLGSNMRERINCPSGRNENRKPLYYIDHNNLLNKLITRNQEI